LVPIDIPYATSYRLSISAVRIFEISNQMVTSVFDASTIIRNFRILTITNLLLKELKKASFLTE